MAWAAVAAVIPSAALPASVESLVRDSSLGAPSPPRGGNPWIWAVRDLDTKSHWGESSYTHTHTASGTP